MRSKIFSFLNALIFVIAALSLQACFYEHSYTPAYGPDPYAYGPGPDYGPGYAYRPPPAYAYVPGRVGDYDDHHAWHDRDWWVEHDHPWVQQHHPGWLQHRRDDDHDRR
jgi:hypothetical protein